MNYIWLIIAFFFVIFELTTPTLFYFLTISISSFCTFLISIYSDSMQLQAFAFFVAIVITYLFLNFLVKKTEKKSPFRSNIFALQGKCAIVLKEITPYNTGTVKIDGQIWEVQSIHNTKIASGSLVEILSIKGIKLIVQDKQS